MAADPSSDPRAWITVGVSVIALLVAGWSAYMARSNLLIARGNAVSRLLDAYASPDMGKALAVLRLSEKAIAMHLAGEYQDRSNFENGVRLSLRFTDSRTDDTPANMMNVLRESGRRIHWFVKQADIMRRNGAMTDNLFRQSVAETNGYRLWATVWLTYVRANPTEDPEPLDWANALVKAIPPSGGKA